MIQHAHFDTVITRQRLTLARCNRVCFFFIESSRHTALMASLSSAEPALAS